jgi:hypothetical protein
LAGGTDQQHADQRASDMTVISRMFSGALMELLQWWLERDSVHTPEWVDHRFHELVWAGLGGR